MSIFVRASIPRSKIVEIIRDAHSIDKAKRDVLSVAMAVTGAGGPHPLYAGGVQPAGGGSMGSGGRGRNRRGGRRKVSSSKSRNLRNSSSSCCCTVAISSTT